MKRFTVQEAEILAAKFRSDIGIGLSEPVSIKTMLRKLGITTMYRPLSDTSFGISCKSATGRMFMLINSNSTRGRQHFTAAHELYHLYYDESPVPHMCKGVPTNGAERCANLFASALLMPRQGVLSMVSPEELKEGKLRISTILRIEQLFEVSRLTLLIRLKDIGLISVGRLEELKALSVKDSARAYGYDLSLYESGNEGLTISDFGEKARMLFEQGRISEGHYIELLNMISYGKRT